ncbi:MULTISPECIES: SCP2 sterol-binding domain-containing protein [unclassified Micromonospora]|uniref:SCP2 sterol-binding domain-containing protein n=1 Tax=Micromonospora TaxID=1873 RepID=UPI00188F7D00|nr:MULTISPECIES: SCP2 sterol-binding domain-containing protein [unclassified Micromonospora]MBF5030060.1 SCP2 sterol-binding domain-containing protein [Micromonospora sp. ANENR4]MCZ7478531.1 SCP2 sterol-binding domain-containing protein [Micromonospora sp. WMMC273]MDW3845156.1 SCP2 sterol-binding domain-containing protein [Micromonospora sp. BRA006-A]MEE3919162.1 SCP2 sterol-binding domain-containing protein [Micromonospora sp. BRA006-A]WBC03219.1 SCP2 sterol-binding domain-containing protein 
MTDFDPANFANVGPKEFAQLVKSTPDAKIAEIMSGDARGKILSEVFNRMPTLFRADRAGATNAVIHWNITGRPDGGTDTYEIVIENGTCTVSETATRDPKLSLTMGPVEFLKIVSGGANPVMMFMTGKLKAKGDLGLAANIANLFDIPKA